MTKETKALYSECPGFKYPFYRLKSTLFNSPPTSDQGGCLTATMNIIFIWNAQLTLYIETVILILFSKLL